MILVSDDHGPTLSGLFPHKIQEATLDELIPVSCQELRYTASELADESASASTASDIYSWALTSLEMTSGGESSQLPWYFTLTVHDRFLKARPFATIKSIVALARAKMQDEQFAIDPHLCSTLRTYPDLCDLLRSCLCRNPALRPKVSLR